VGDYDFNPPGVQSIPVQRVDCGFECVTLTALIGTRVDLDVNRRGNRYEGLFDADPHGAMCIGHTDCPQIRALAPKQ
jgi:hypothetical protein